MCQAARVENARLHDLRRTVGSWLAQQGASLYLVGQILNHTDPSTTQVYAHLSEANAREALEVYGQAILATAGAPPDWAQLPALSEPANG